MDHQIIKMNIALVTPYFPDEHTMDSGIANHYQLLAQSLAKSGHQVTVLHVRGRYENEQDAFNSYTPAPNITVLTYKVKVPPTVYRLFKNKWAIIDLVIKLRCMLVTAKVLNKIIKASKIDVVETSSYFSLCYFTLYKKAKAPIAVRVSTTFAQMMKEHYPFKSRGMDVVAAMEIAFIKKSSNLVTHAYSHAEELERLYHVNANSFVIIPHGVNLPPVSPQNSSGALPIKVLYTGRLEYRKGTDVLLAAIPLVLQKNPEVLFELIGHDPGNQYQTWFEQENEAYILQQVNFRGRVPDQALADAYQNCDLFVAPSRYESFGIIYIEAMSYAKPVIGCSVGGVPDIITDNHNGALADPGDAQSLADKILMLVNDTALRTEMGRNARKTVEDKFTGEKLAANSSFYYQTLR